MLVHNCTVTGREIDIVAEHFTAPVTWVLCPGSNRYISGLTPPVELLRKNHLDIAVGSDSLASNDTLSIVRELSLLRDVPLAELLVWATLNGARALGMEDSLGSIEKGKSPGLVHLTGVDMQRLVLTENARAGRII
jgi:cytosine/adenosine deaminase-related metal-dependent hydrolase